MNNRIFLVAPLVLILLSLCVTAEDYVKTGAKDFSVYIDPSAQLSGFVYGTVKVNMTGHEGDTFKCINSVYYDKGGGQLMHVQSNPPHSPQNRWMVFSNPAESPETLGYFKLENGVGNIYYRSKDLIPYNNFTLVVFCNSDGVAHGGVIDELVYEEDISPVYGQAFKSLPSRGAWFAESQNADMIVIVVVVILLIIMWIWYRVK
jgi:hypothetical protein